MKTATLFRWHRLPAIRHLTSFLTAINIIPIRLSVGQILRETDGFDLSTISYRERPRNRCRVRRPFLQKISRLRLPPYEPGVLLPRCISKSLKATVGWEEEHFPLKSRIKHRLRVGFKSRRQHVLLIGLGKRSTDIWVYRVLRDEHITRRNFCE